jgi:hypothetical protein
MLEREVAVSGPEGMETPVAAKTCVKARWADGPGSEIVRCGLPAVTFSVGDGHQSFYCEAHSSKDELGFYNYGLAMEPHYYARYGQEES